MQIFTRSGQHRDAGRDLERVVEGLHERRRRAIGSPNARYLQWRAVLTSDSAQGPVLTSVTAAYLPRNLRPEVDVDHRAPARDGVPAPFSTGELEIAGFEDNTSDGRPPNQPQRRARRARRCRTPALGRRIYQKGLQTFVWKADDENDDRLQFDVFYRREGETAWKALKRGLWDPDLRVGHDVGARRHLRLKVAASDAPSNSPDTALVGELESISFDIDNTPPRIELQPATRAGARTTISFVVRDEQSAVQRVEYSLDASRWRSVYPKDGIAGFAAGRVRGDAGRERSRPQRDHPRDRRDEQRGDGGGDRSEAAAKARTPDSRQFQRLRNPRRLRLDRRVREQPHQVDGHRRRRRSGAGSRRPRRQRLERSR